MCQEYDSIVPRCLDALYRTGYRMANRIMANGLARRDGGGLSAMNTGKGMVTLVRAFPVCHTHAMEIPAVVTNNSSALKSLVFFVFPVHAGVP